MARRQEKQQEKQFEKIYDSYVDKIYRFVFLKVDSQEAAQDVTSQVFTKGWTRFRTGARIENVPAYLYQIARSEIANHYRDVKKYQVVSVEALEVVDATQDIEGKHIARADMAMVKKLLSQLEEDSQNVLIWRYLDDYSNKEIAEMLGKSEGAVRVMLSRALGQLREKAAQKWPENLFGREA